MSNCVVCDETTEVVIETEESATIIETPSDPAVTIETPTTSVVEVSTSNTTLTVETVDASVVEVVDTGPQMIPDELMRYARRTDFVTDEKMYVGEALPGTNGSTAAWRIKRIRFLGVDEDVTEDWAGGSAAFNQVWNDRESLSYT